jgi:hypothetical protein
MYILCTLYCLLFIPKIYYKYSYLFQCFRTILRASKLYALLKLQFIKFIKITVP